MRQSIPLNTGTIPRLPRWTMALVLAVAVSGCEIRRDDQPDAKAQGPLPEPQIEQAEAPPTPDAVSIIREEIAPPVPIILPPQPLDLTIPFPDSAGLTQEARTLLAEVMQSEALQQGWPIIIAGHTDSSGNDQANLRTSRARAEAVAAWLVERGVADERIEVIAFGEQNPIAPNALPDGSANEEGRRTNRRVEVRIAPPEPST